MGMEFPPGAAGGVSSGPGSLQAAPGWRGRREAGKAPGGLPQDHLSPQRPSRDQDWPLGCAECTCELWPQERGAAAIGLVTRVPLPRCPSLQARDQWHRPILPLGVSHAFLGASRDAPPLSVPVCARVCVWGGCKRRNRALLRVTQHAPRRPEPRALWLTPSIGDLPADPLERTRGS